MDTLHLIFTIIQLLASLFLIAVVLLQSGKSSGLSGAISGGAETFMSKGKAKTWDAKLAKMTKWFALGFVVLTLVLNLMARSNVGAETEVPEDPAAAAETVDEAEPAA